MASEVTVTPSCIAAMNRAGSLRDPQDELARAGCPAAWSSCIRVRRTVTSAYSAADEEPVQQNQRRDGDELEKEGHAPSPGAQVLGGSSFSKEATPRV